MKKGYTLIELVISVGISLMIFGMVLEIFVVYKKLYVKDVKSNKQNIYLKGANLFIEAKLEEGTRIKLLNNNVQNIIEHKISIVNEGERKINTIRLDNRGNLIIVYEAYTSSENNSYYLGENIILRDIELFEVNINRNVMYVTIKCKDGEKIERCLGIRR